MVKHMQRTNTIQREIGWAKVFLSFLKEAETESDQIRMRGMGIQWTPGPSPHHGSDLVQYFQTLDNQRNEAKSDRLAKAAGSRIIRSV